MEEVIKYQRASYKAKDSDNHCRNSRIEGKHIILSSYLVHLMDFDQKFKKKILYLVAS